MSQRYSKDRTVLNRRTGTPGMCFSGHNTESTDIHTKLPGRSVTPTSESCLHGCSISGESILVLTVILPEVWKSQYSTSPSFSFSSPLSIRKKSPALVLKGVGRLIDTCSTLKSTNVTWRWILNPLALITTGVWADGSHRAITRGSF